MATRPPRACRAAWRRAGVPPVCVRLACLSRACDLRSSSSASWLTRYKQQFDIKTLIPFSGEGIDPDLGGAFTEVAVNQGFKEKQLSEKFAGDDLV